VVAGDEQVAMLMTVSAGGQQSTGRKEPAEFQDVSLLRLAFACAGRRIYRKFDEARLNR
jgi:hypothetical protein